MGRPPKLTPHQVKEALRRRDAGEPMRDIARTYNVSHTTISRLGSVSLKRRGLDRHSRHDLLSRIKPGMGGRPPTLVARTTVSKRSLLGASIRYPVKPVEDIIGYG